MTHLKVDKMHIENMLIQNVQAGMQVYTTMGGGSGGAIATSTGQFSHPSPEELKAILHRAATAPARVAEAPTTWGGYPVPSVQDRIEKGERIIHKILFWQKVPLGIGDLILRDLADELDAVSEVLERIPT